MRWLVGFGLMAILAGCACGTAPTLRPDAVPSPAPATPTATAPAPSPAAPDGEGTPAREPAMLIGLPRPRSHGPLSVEEALLQRRSTREYASEALTLGEVSQLLWAAQGLTAEWGGRTAPSAGALYPLEVYLAVGSVQGLSAGVYRYEPRGHTLDRVRDGDVRRQLADAAVGQACVEDGAVDIVIAAVFERTAKKYGDRAARYVHMEAGHAAQNVYLQATALGLGTVAIGAFHDDQVRRIVGMREHEAPLYVMPVGRKPTAAP